MASATFPADPAVDPSLIIVLLVLAAVALFVLPPLLREEAGSPVPSPASPGDALAEAASRRDTSYEALADLEFDHASGKISDEEFVALKARYQRDAVAALRDLEGLQRRKEAHGPVSGPETGPS